MCLLLCAGVLPLACCQPMPKPETPPPFELARMGDEIVIAGRFFHTGVPVVLWTDPGGYDAYRTERRFVPFDQSEWRGAAPGEANQTREGPETPSRFGLRYQHSAASRYTAEQLETIRGGGWTLDMVQDTVDQFVLHYDVAGTSRQCFRVLHDLRGLSVHFLLDIDGTIYQTLDVKERAWHATTSNDRSVGIEIANIGAYPTGNSGTLDKWYTRVESQNGGPGRTIISLPASMGDGGVRTAGPFSPSREEPVIGSIQGREYAMYDLTPQQYESLAHLTAALCRALPRITCDAPRGADGRITTEKLADDVLANYQGILGHYHIQKNKVDPGPAFQWEKFLAETRALMPQSVVVESTSNE